MNETTLRAYLLGRLPEDEAARLEERVLQDEDTFETLRSIEDDLFDEFARNRMADGERQRFLERYGTRHDRMAFAQALAARKAGGRVLQFPRGRWLAGLAAAAVLVLAVGSIFMRPKAPVPADVTVAAPPAVQPAPGLGPSVVVALTLGTSRATGSARAVTLPEAARALDLRVSLDSGDRFEVYSLELRSAADKVVWRADDVRSTIDAGVLTLRAEVPASAVGDGTYELAVRGGPRREDLGFVTLEVHRAR